MGHAVELSRLGGSLSQMIFGVIKTLITLSSLAQAHACPNPDSERNVALEVLPCSFSALLTS
jgi:hypothetical protein